MSGAEWGNLSMENARPTEPPRNSVKLVLDNLDGALNEMAKLVAEMGIELYGQPPYKLGDEASPQCLNEQVRILADRAATILGGLNEIHRGLM